MSPTSAWGNTRFVLRGVQLLFCRAKSTRRPALLDQRFSMCRPAQLVQRLFCASFCAAYFSLSVPASAPRRASSAPRLICAASFCAAYFSLSVPASARRPAHLLRLIASSSRRASFCVAPPSAELRLLQPLLRQRLLLLLGLLVAPCLLLPLLLPFCRAVPFLGPLAATFFVFTCVSILLSLTDNNVEWRLFCFFALFIPLASSLLVAPRGASVAVQ